MKRIVLIALIGLAGPRLAAAQDAAPPLQENPKAAHFKDVERGFYVGFSAGYMGLFKTPTEDRAKYPAAGSSGGRAGGMMVGAEIGMDLSSRLTLSLIAQGGNEHANADYGGFSLYGAGADVRYSYYGSKDRNDWERLFLYVHGRGAYALTYPKGLFGTSDVLIQLGPGVEYFTRLRHFSIGFALDFLYATKAKSPGFAAYPTVRYTF